MTHKAVLVGYSWCTLNFDQSNYVALCYYDKTVPWNSFIIVFKLTNSPICFLIRVRKCTYFSQNCTSKIYQGQLRAPKKNCHSKLMIPLMIRFFPSPFLQLLLSPNLHWNSQWAWFVQWTGNGAFFHSTSCTDAWSSYSAKLTVNFHAYLWIFIYNIILCVQPWFILSFCAFCVLSLHL